MPTSNQTLQPPTYSLTTGDCYQAIIKEGAGKSEADQREILRIVGGRIGGQLVELYDISLSLGQTHEAAFKSAIEEYDEYLAKSD